MFLRQGGQKDRNVLLILQTLWRTSYIKFSPGDTVNEEEEETHRQDGDQEPGEDDAHHPQAEQDHGQVLHQHLSLHGQTHVHCWKEK